MAIPVRDPGVVDRLVRRLSVAFEFTLPDERTLQERIYQQRAQAWRDALTDEARAVGSAKTGQGPTGAYRQYLLDLSRDDAQSIRNTFNRELRSQIAQLYAANPDGRRDYYVTALTRWADQRAAYKDRQIALMNEKTARQYAQLAFKDRNRVTQAQFLFDGPAPVCDDCVDLFAAGTVDQAFVEANPTPVHPNCPHQWRTLSGVLGVALQDVWVG